MSRTRRRLAAVAAVAATAVFAPSAQAGPLAESATDCEQQDAARVFLPWADVAQYVQAPGARAESADGWTLDGASVVPGNEPWHVVSSSDSSSVSLPAGASATTDVMCVGITHPTIRFFNKQNSGGLLAHVKVDVLFEGAGGLVEELPVGADKGYGWHPTAPMAVGASLLPLLPGEMTPVRFRFTASGGSFQIDDVHVDPWGRR